MQHPFPCDSLGPSAAVRVRRITRALGLLVLLLLSLTPRLLHAQDTDGPLSEAEIEQLREAAYQPVDRVAVFIKLLDTRATAIQTLVSKPRRPGREEDLHELLQQFASVLDELNDNLDDYGAKHRDLRKQLPRLVQATDRWATALRSPAEVDLYKIARSLALEGTKDAHDEAARLIDEQKTWFAAHPPPKEPVAPRLEDRR